MSLLFGIKRLERSNVRRTAFVAMDLLYAHSRWIYVHGTVA